MPDPLERQEISHEPHQNLKNSEPEPLLSRQKTSRDLTAENWQQCATSALDEDAFIQVTGWRVGCVQEHRLSCLLVLCFLLKLEGELGAVLMLIACLKCSFHALQLILLEHLAKNGQARVSTITARAVHSVHFLPGPGAACFAVADLVANAARRDQFARALQN